MSKDLSYIVPELRRFAVPVDSLVLDPKNANTHPDENRASVRHSLEARGQTLPITVRKATRVVMTGNCTLEETISLGRTHIAAVFLDYTEEQAAEWGIAHNLGAHLAKWDYEQLAATIAEYPDVDWIGTGFEANELEALLAEHAKSDEPDTTTVSEHEREVGGESDDDEIPDTPAEPITKVGDIIQLGRHTLHCCDCMDLLRSLPDNSIDAIVTDPPYGLSPDGRARTWDEIEELRREGKGPKSGFMGKEWDAGVPGITWARECLRVLKPGGHIIAHSATRTIHRLTTALEDAGFEIRDQIGWLRWGQSFPKSHNVSLAIDEHMGATRTVERDRRRVPDASRTRPQFAGFEGGDSTAHREYVEYAPATPEAERWDGWGTGLKSVFEPAVFARKPIGEATVATNVLKWGTGAINIDACRMFPGDPAWPGPYTNGDALWPGNVYYCPKPSRTERNEGCEELPQLEKAQIGGAIEYDDPVSARFRSAPMGNIHTTVKPVKLYRWLLRLVTPPGGRVFESFGGSGTTLVAACDLDCEVIAAEREPKYCDIIRARVEHRLARS